MVCDRTPPCTPRGANVEGFATAATGRVTGVAARAPFCGEQV